MSDHDMDIRMRNGFKPHPVKRKPWIDYSAHDRRLLMEYQEYLRNIDVLEFGDSVDRFLASRKEGKTDE